MRCSRPETGVGGKTHRVVVKDACFLQLHACMRTGTYNGGPFWHASKFVYLYSLS